MKKLFCILCVCVISLPVYGDMNWDATEKLFKEVSPHFFRNISRELRTLFLRGDVARFNALRSQYPDIVINLQEVQCQDRRLKGINLQNAILTHSDFQGCDLEEAQFQNSYLPGTNWSSFYGLDETNLNNTNFTGAIFHKQNEIESKIAQFYDDRIHRINRRRISRINKAPVQVDYSVYFYNTDLTGVTGLDPDILETHLQNEIIGMTATLSTGQEGSVITSERGIYVFNDFYTILNSMRPYQTMVLTERSPFVQSLREEDREKLIGRPAWILCGQHFANDSFDVINTDPRLVMILSNFSSHGYVKTAGDVIIAGNRWASRENQFDGQVFYSYYRHEEGEICRQFIHNRPYRIISPGMAGTYVPEHGFESIDKDKLETITANNPFILSLNGANREANKKRFIGKKAWVLCGRHLGSTSFDVLNSDPDIVIILDRFSSHGYIKSSGDIILANSHQEHHIQMNDYLFYSSYNSNRPCRDP